jgi:hypothetical protein
MVTAMLVTAMLVTAMVVTAMVVTAMVVTAMVVTAMVVTAANPPNKLTFLFYFRNLLHGRLLDVQSFHVNSW